ncbi:MULTISPECIES: hypothetical protein [Olivibacter]|uniref:Uncharacterized protein n=1 Tax=Olivibacter jilunii TaxID=985016 RepID=A0ABW6B1B5_9SPHI|nr:hypothetical protein [Pseudosphingobacterium sp.]
MDANKEIINPGTGILARNIYKQNERSPDYVGQIVTLDGAKFEVSGWVQKTNAGSQYLSLSVKEEGPLYPPKL